MNRETDKTGDESDGVKSDSEDDTNEKVVKRNIGTCGKKATVSKELTRFMG